MCEYVCVCVYVYVCVCVRQLDYMKNFLMHYIPNEITLHKIVYPHWEDSAEKFKRFALSDKIELNYRQVCFVVGMGLFCGRIR